MFEVSAWCIVVSAVLAAGVWLDGRGHQPLWRLPAVAWAVFVGVTWVGIILYLIARLRPPSLNPRPMSGHIRFPGFASEVDGPARMPGSNIRLGQQPWDLHRKVRCTDGGYLDITLHTTIRAS